MTGKNFIPNSSQRKERRRRKEVDKTRKLSLDRDSMQALAESKVHIKAFDASISYAFSSLLGFRPRKAMMIDHVIISTDVPLPRDEWLKIVKMLEESIKNQEEKRDVKS